MFHLRQLQCLLALAKHRHFGRAADAVGITQSGLTQSIRRLEEHFGVELFARDRKGATPTAFGEVVVQGAGQVLDRVAAMEREVQLLDNLETGQLVVGVDPMLATSLLAPALTALLHKHHRLRFSVRSGGWNDLLPQLAAGALDLFIGFEGTQSMSRLERRDFLVDAPLVVGAPGHPLLERDRSLADYFEFPLVQGPLAKWYLDWAEKQLEPAKTTFDLLEPYFLHANDAGLLVDIAKNSDAMLAAMREDLASTLASGELVEIPPPNWPEQIPVVLAWSADRPVSPAAERLMEEILEVIPEQVTSTAETP